ncbi:hypothetical protein [Paenibacillus sp. 32352]|uniref:hypothetical protein n=1 Tax=Paenibacillus sp. 32352 TaxID=1969111 RepID=UPI00117E26F8|nr:hypothetical protein [Paenibacillus sp. 32352]
MAVIIAERTRGMEFETLPCREKAVHLRRYEEYCYQIAFYLLNNEKQASEAAEHALMELYRCREWFDMPDNARQAKAKQAALMQALESKKRGLSRAL